ncbi:MAG: CRISPR-associated helicase Cas3' [Ignavibacteriae bacterium]|nr:MAG: CRISPR-associated helicase Cas3' [Ignavibacteriota bacterium]
MNYFSHSKVGNDGNVYGTKRLIDHINGVLEKAHLHYSSNLDLGYAEKELKDLLKIIIQFHDLGKYTSYFQNYLLKKNPVDYTLKQHARIGGLAAYNLLKEKNEKQALLAMFLIFLHHSQLSEPLQILEKLNDHLIKIIEHQKVDLAKFITNIEKDMRLVKLSNIIYYPEEKPIRKAMKEWVLRNSTIQDYYLINYLFSLLIEADKLDASDTQIYNRKQIPAEAVSIYLNELDTTKSSLEQIELRNKTRESVLKNLERNDILEKKLFTFTAPTGIGKTLTALDFSIKLKDKIRKKQNREAQIIYALPFINIIEQAYEVYRNVLPDEIKLLAHYQYADAFEQLITYDEEVSGYNQKIMTIDTWQCDVVITSFVQFLQTLIGNRNKLLKKFHHFAGSIIILDEVQTIRLEQLPLVGAALYYLSKYLDARIILMTATKPKIFELANNEILGKENEKAESFELLEKHVEVFKKLHRTKLVPLIAEPVETDEAFINESFKKYWSDNKSCLIVVNTVNRSINLYSKLRKFVDENKMLNQIYYLSTNIIPIHRLNIIESIKKDLGNGEKPILVSTQCVEAGVDLDFDMGFRDLAPIDSIIQVAGRINRNNDKKKQFSPLYIFDFKDCSKIYGTLTNTQTKEVFKNNDEFVNEINECDYLELIEKYLSTRNEKESYSYSRNIFNSMKKLRYDGDENDFPVSIFKVIKEQEFAESVFIEIDERAIQVKENFLKLSKKEISREQYESNKKDFNQRIITVPKNYLKSLKQEGNRTNLSDNLLIVPKELIKDYYNSEKGFIRKKECDDGKIVML